MKFFVDTSSSERQLGGSWSHESLSALMHFVLIDVGLLGLRLRKRTE